jgi:AcrR family transcriptional regulator
MAINTGVRQANRERIESAIRESARRQLASVGAAGISLRDIARELGVVSSAIYRYVPSRDALLTWLIVESYNSLGAAVEADAERTRRRSDARRWVSAANAVREWAIERPHDFQLLYGTPVPGYSAPPDTVEPGVRVTFALAAIVADARREGRLAEPAPGAELTRALQADLRQLSSDAAIALDPPTVLAFVMAWTQLFGLVTFELTNQTRGMSRDHAALFDATARQSAHNMGLRD